jgi:hypothetical protein
LASGGLELNDTRIFNPGKKTREQTNHIRILSGVDIKLAGSLSLAENVPTMIVGFARYSQAMQLQYLRASDLLFFGLLSALCWVLQSPARYLDWCPCA